ncbi:MAG TPA: non-ribosomal peptide synthetase [Casimicrobiaceae bacterium]|nr:non-ribosomal peptide synthetase [Casimicrobiaceae bacterium]
MRSPTASAPDGEPQSSFPADQRAIRSSCFHPHGSWVYRDPDVVDRTIHGFVEGQAEANPAGIAVVTPQRALSYRALNQAANRFARRIVGRGGAPDAPIGVCCALGASQVIALLAVSKAARFYLSLPPADPPERNRRLLEEAGIETVICDHANLHVATALSGDGPAILNVDSVDDDGTGDNLRLDVSVDSLVRLSMTSGSTGEPKAVMQTHRTVLYGAIARNNAVHLCAEDRMLIATAAFTDLWRPLLVGATLYLFDLKADDMACLRRWFAEGSVTAFRLTPSVLRHLVRVLADDEPGDARGATALFPSLRVVELLGEPVPAECVALFQESFPQHCVLINFLGAKEVLDYRLFYMDHETRVAGEWVPSGYALAGTRALVLDDAGNPVRDGNVGEIFVQSRSMSPGYWRDAALTSERFAVATEGGRTYRTGDLGRLLADGCLLYVGRRDSMVKIRGHRVDLDPLERSLRALHGVRDAAVVVAEAAAREAKLVAFVVAEEGDELDERVLRRALGARLPDFNIPSAFAFLESMPATPLGKTDRAALRALAAQTRPPSAELPLQATRIESEIAAIWAHVLERSEIDANENFFEIGGDSLTVMRVARAIQRRFEIELPLAVLFERPTVTAIAAYVRQALPPSHPRVESP